MSWRRVCHSHLRALSLTNPLQALTEVDGCMTGTFLFLTKVMHEPQSHKPTPLQLKVYIALELALGEPTHLYTSKELFYKQAITSGCPAQLVTVFPTQKTFLRSIAYIRSYL